MNVIEKNETEFSSNLPHHFLSKLVWYPIILNFNSLTFHDIYIINYFTPSRYLEKKKIVM